MSSRRRTRSSAGSDGLDDTGNTTAATLTTAATGAAVTTATDKATAARSRTTTTSVATPLAPHAAVAADNNAPTAATTTTTTTTTLSYKHSRRTVFRARTSRLDTDTIAAEQPEFRGFYMLFWICLTIYMANTFLFHWRREGVFFRTRLMPIFVRDLAVFGLIDGVMVASTLVCVLVQRLLITFSGLVATGGADSRPGDSASEVSASRYRLAAPGTWRRRLVIPLWVGVLVKHLLQTALVCGSIAFTYWRDWMWPQTATFVLHSVAMYMKMHAYLSYNEELEAARRRSAHLLATIDESDDAQHMARMEVELAELEKEMQRGDTRYPANVTVSNFVDYLLIPSMVYELEYPRRDKVRVGYIIEKAVATFGIVTVLYFMLEHFIYPVLDDMAQVSFIESVLRLLLPFTVGWLMIFFIIFECVCNASAEMTRFADRGFYEDWWNSNNFEEFARKWNKPVHEFLLRHVYLEAIDTYKLSRRNASYLTFLFSSVLHELVIGVVARKISFVFFAAQMSQIPLIWVGKLPWVRARPLVGNFFFWVSLMSGMPLIAVLYTRDYFIQQQAPQ